MSYVNRNTAALNDIRTMVVVDHFTSDQSDLWAIDTVTDTGTVLIGDEAGGVVTLTPSDGTVADNDEAYIATPNELFRYLAANEIYGTCRLKFAEVTAAIVNVAFGFQNAVGANSIIDDGAGLKVSGSTLAIYKIDGEAVWRCVSACNGVATVSVSTSPAVAATWYEPEIFCLDHDGVTMLVSFKVDGRPLKDANGQDIRHKVAIASSTEMSMFAGVKLGAITNNDALKLDWWYGAQAPAA
jgi:hypothetical protein